MRLSKVPIYELHNEFKIELKTFNECTGICKQLHIKKFYELIIIKKGKAELVVDFETITLKANSGYLIRPNQTQKLNFDITKVEGYIIQFCEEVILPDTLMTFFSTLKSSYNNSELYQDNALLTDRIIDIFSAINDVFLEKSKHYQKIALHIVSILFYILADASPALNEESINYSEKVKKFLGLVEDKLNSISIQQYENELGISSKKLTTEIKHYFNTTPLKYIHKVLMIKIKRDLAIKHLNFKEIAFKYNFDSQQNFSAFVKKNTGLSPSQLQKSLII